jgi:8-oxo-dGTP pyrophosphatase MutT (NUDIX family)
MSIDQKIHEIRKQLKKPLPGKEQQYLMSPEFRGDFPSNSIGRNAAVMLCLFQKDNELQLIFIKRRKYDGPHGGQVSFPGGVSEEIDTDLEDTAIRETMEEIGIECERSWVLGALTPLTIPVSNMHVHPFVSFYGKNPEFVPETREVDYLIISSLSELSDPACIKKEKWMLHGMEIEVPYYSVNGEIIWGATAMILCEFLSVISRSGQDSRSGY